MKKRKDANLINTIRGKISWCNFMNFINAIKEKILWYDFMNFINRKRKEILGGNSLEKSIYSDLTPTDNLSNEEESLKALHWALANPKIKNIALTGPYGAGKSSIIASYLKQHKKCKAINISLATFDGKPWDQVQKLTDEQKFEEAYNVQKEFEDELERGILKQLFYKVDADKIPLSRYRKLHHRNLWKYMLGVILLLIMVLSGMYLAFPDEVAAFLVSYRDGIVSFKETVFVIAAFIFVLYGSSYVIRFVTSKFIIKEISVGDISAQGDVMSTDSVLSRNIDEMLYFFERTKYNVVFIEDLDRFNNTSIFIKLREINKILNNYDLIKRRGKISFVYAVRDDLFREKTDRIKFFDFLIPVIPVINFTNSGEKMRDLLGIGETKEENKDYPPHDISSHFVTLVSPYIGDMRILISVINEFWVYKRTLKDSREVQLKDENMLALMIYKNLYPKDFALLEGEEGNIKEAFRYKAAALKNAQVSLENRKNDLKQLQQDIAASVTDIKILILSELVNHKGCVSEIIVSNRTYSYADLLADSFSFDGLRKDQIRVYYRPYDSSSERDGGSFSNLEYSSVRFRDLFQRYERQRKYLDRQTRNTQMESDKIDQEIINLRASTMQQLIANYPLEDILPESVRENNILIFMLRHGYINESYADYINYFHAGSISKEELNFILSIRDFKGENDFAYSIQHCANVVDRLYDYEFKQVEALNFDLTDFLIESEKNRDKLQFLIEQLANGSEMSMKFNKAYIDRGENAEKFIRLLCHESSVIWVAFMNDEQLSKVKNDKYFKLIISSCEIEDIKKNNDPYIDEENEIYGVPMIKEYFENDENILHKMSDVSWEKLLQVIVKLDIRFDNLNLVGLEKNQIDDIIQKRRFELNHSMMESICQALIPDAAEMLFKANYQWLRDLNNTNLLDYVHDEFVTYVRNFIIDVASNTEEGVEAVDDMIERLSGENQELCIAVIQKQHRAYWARLTDCPVKYEAESKQSKQSTQSIWDCLMSNHRTDATWNNYLLYYNLFGLSDALLSFFDKNIDAILESGDDESITDESIEDEIIKQLIVKDLSERSFTKLISKYKVEAFTNSLSEFTEGKLKIMIQKRYFEFSPERLAELKDISHELSLEFIYQNLPDFLENMEECVWDLADIKGIIKQRILENKKNVLKVIDNNDLIKLLEMIEPKDIDKEFASLLRNLRLTLPKTYVEAMWQVLDEKDRYQLLNDHLDVYHLDEIAQKFGELGGVYDQFSARTKHKFTLHWTEFNEDLCKKLLKKEFLSSYDITTEKNGDEFITQITGYVKKKPEK